MKQRDSFYKWRLICLGLIAALAPVGRASAANFTWTNTNNGTSGYWTNGSLWVGGTAYPGSNVTDSAFLTNATPAGTSYTNILNATLTNLITTLAISNSTGGQSWLIVTNASLTNTTLSINNGGRLQIDNGGVVTNAGITWRGTNGTIYLNSGGTLVAAAAITIGGTGIAGVTATVTRVGTTGPAGTWDFTGKTLTVGAANSTGNVLRVDGGGVTGGVILTNTSTAQTTLMLGVGNSFILTNGAQAWFAANQLVDGTSNTWKVVGGGPGVTTLVDVPNNLQIGSAAGSVGNTLVVDGNGVYGGAVVTNGGQFRMGTVAGAMSNGLSIVNGGWFFAPGTFAIGYTGGANSNFLNVGSAGMTSFMSMGGGGIGNGAGSFYNTMTTTNAVIRGKLIIGASSSSNTVTVLKDTAWDFAGNNLMFAGSAMSTGNVMVINGGVVSNVSTVVFGNGTAGSVGSSLTVSNGGQLLANGAVILGNSANSSNNTFNVGGLGAASFVSNTTISLGGQGSHIMTVTNATLWSTAVTIGTGSSNNTATINAGGYWSTLGTTFTVGNNAATGNVVRINAGGILEANTLVTGAGAGNVITNAGGIYQFSIANPTNTPNAGAGSIALYNGTISFTNVTSGLNLTNNWKGSGLTNMAFSGFNTLRLNNSTATNTLAGGYTFKQEAGNATNYYRLELINGNTAITGNGITIAATGQLLVSNTTASFNGVLTNSGFATLVNSTESFANGLVNQGTITNFNNNTFVGLLTMNNGTLVTAGGAQTWASNINLQATGWFDTSSGDLTVAGVLTNTGPLVKLGTGNLVLTATNTFSGGASVNGGQLMLANIFAVSNSTVTVNAAGLLGFSNGTTFVVGGLAGAGTVGLTNTANQSVTLNVGTNGASTTFSGALNGGGALVKSGTGLLLLSGANTFTGGTTVSNGTLQLGSASAFPNATALRVDGGIFDQNGRAITVSTLNGTAAGTITNAGLAVTSGGSFAGAIAGSGALTNNGGVLVLSGANTYSGGTVVQTGTLKLNSAGAFPASSALTVDGGIFDQNGRAITVTTLNGTGGVITNAGLAVTGGGSFAGAIAGTGALTNSGGVLTISGANTYSGGTVVQSGTLKLGGAGALPNNQALTVNGGIFDQNGNAITVSTLNGSGGVITNAGLTDSAGGSYSGVMAGSGVLVHNGGTLALSGANLFSGGATVSNGTLLAGHNTALGSGAATVADGATLGLSNSLSGVNNALTLSGTGVSGGGALRNLAGNNTYNGVINLGAAALIAANANQLTISGNITNNGYDLTFGGASTTAVSGVIVGSGALIKTGAGTLTLSGINTYEAGTTLSNGWLVAAHNSAFSTGVVTMAGGTLTASGNRTLDNAFTLAQAGTVDTAGNSLTLAGEIAGASANSLTKTGSGTLTYLGTNSYSGATVINQGVLVFGHGSAATNSTVTPNINGGVLFSNANSFIIGGLAGTGNVSLQNTDGNGVALTAGNNNASTLYGGVLSGSGSLTKIGGGTLELTNASTFTGGTVLNAGMLKVNNVAGSGLGSGAVTINGGTLGGTGTVAGAVTVNSGGHLAAGNSVGTQSYGALTLNNGSVLDIEFNGSANDRYVVTNFNGLTINDTTKVYLYIENTPTAFNTLGTYNLINYYGTIGGDGVSGLAVQNYALNRSYSFGEVLGSSNWVVLTIGGTGAGWVGAAGNSYWGTLGNWQTNGTSYAIQAGDQLIFDGTTRAINTNNFANNTQFNGILFNNSLGIGNFVLEGMGAHTNIVNLTGNVLNNSTKAQTINLDLVLDSASRTFLANGTLTVNGDIGQSAAGFGVTKTGAGLLALNGTNSYTGVTEIRGGTLRVTNSVGLPSNSNLKFNGGVYESVGSFTRSTGTVAGAVQWVGNGGFSAVGSTLTVNLNNNAAPLTWGSAGFVPTDRTLLFGSSSAGTGRVDFLNPINLNGGTRTVDVAGAGFVVDLQGALNSASGGLVKTGSGTMRLSANNSYAGATAINAGGLIVDGTLASGALNLNTGTSLSGTGALASVISGGGAVNPGNGDGILTVNRLDPSANLNFNFEFTQLGSPDYTQPGASLNDVLRITNSTPFAVALGVTNTVNLYVTAPLTVGITNVFRGGFYTDNSAFFDNMITGAVYNLIGSGTLAYRKTVNETDTQFGGKNGYVMEFGVYLSQPLVVIPEPQVLTFWLSGAVVLWTARRRRPGREKQL